MSDPFISVIVPVYNVEKYIKRCVDSLIGQNYDNYEILLVDDGSTDGSGKICDELAEKYNMVSAYHKTNGGLGDARNYGLGKATGEYVVFIDSDDWIDQDYFEFLKTNLKNNNLDLFKYGYRKIRSGEVFATTFPYFDEGIYDRKEIEEDILPGTVGPISLFDYTRTPLLSACVCAYSLEFLRKNNIYFKNEREVLSEDHLFNMEAMVVADRIGISHKIVYNYDFREGSLSKRYVTDMLKRKETLINSYKKILEERSLFERYKTAYYSQWVDGYYACITNECGPWADKSRSLKNVRYILNLKNCRESLKKCRHNNLTKKGLCIYWLMRMRQAKAMCALYRKAKR